MWGFRNSDQLTRQTWVDCIKAIDIYFMIFFISANLSMVLYSNRDLAKYLPLEVNPDDFGSSSTKAYLLYQAHFSRIKMPSSDYITDLKSVLDQSFRILQVLVLYTV